MTARVKGPVAEVVDYPDDRKVALLAEAVEQAREGQPSVRGTRIGVYLGTGLSSVTPQELAEDVYPHVVAGRVDSARALADTAPNRVAPRRHLPDRATAWLARKVGAEGPGGTSFSACAAAAEAIAHGARAIARGDADLVYVGGHDAMLHPIGRLSFRVLGALSSGIARPFDLRRDGFVLGEGAAILRLERADRCKDALGFVLGAGSSIDAFGLTAPPPDGAGAEAAMRRAMVDAGISASHVDWVNAHATGTVVGDRAEAAAIARLLPGVAVSSLKGALGHGLAAAGALEAVATVLAWQGGFTPGTVGCELPEPGIEVRLEVRPKPPGLTLSNSFGFGGQNVCLCLAPEPA
jgi:3-oxoacyl-[acyl-carrier-protein] synthase II